MILWNFLGCLRGEFRPPPPLSLQQNTLIFILRILAPTYAPLPSISQKIGCPPEIFPKKTWICYIVC